MEGVAGISRPPTALSGGRVKMPAPSATFRWNTPPSVGRSKGGEVPSFTARFFCLIRSCQVALHEDADRAMVTEGYPLEPHRPQIAPLDISKTIASPPTTW